MLAELWMTRVEPVMRSAGRDLGELVRQAKQFFLSLNTSEKLVLLCLFMIGLFAILLKHFQSPEEGERASGRFVGGLFLIGVVAASLGWMAAGYNA